MSREEQKDKTHAVLTTTKDGAVPGLNDKDGKHRVQSVKRKDWLRLKLIYGKL
jgi:hypothetical protein